MSAEELRELDAFIAEYVMGYKWIAFDASTFKHGGKGAEFCTLEIPSERLLRNGGKIVDAPISDFERDIGGVPKYSTDPAAAMRVLEKCLAGIGSTSLHMNNLGGRFIIYWGTDRNFSERVEASTLPLAICRFAKQCYSKQ